MLRVASGRGGSRLWWGRATARLTGPARQSAPMTRLRRQAMTCGAVPVRTWEPSSAKVTSRIQCRPCSIAQWAHRRSASRAGLAWAKVRLVIAYAVTVRHRRVCRARRLRVTWRTWAACGNPKWCTVTAFEGADLDPAVGLVARAVQDRNTMPGKRG